MHDIDRDLEELTRPPLGIAQGKRDFEEVEVAVEEAADAIRVEWSLTHRFDDDWKIHHKTKRVAERLYEQFESLDAWAYGIVRQHIHVFADRFEAEAETHDMMSREYASEFDDPTAVFDEDVQRIVDQCFMDLVAESLGEVLTEIIDVMEGRTYPLALEAAARRRREARAKGLY